MPSLDDAVAGPAQAAESSTARFGRARFRRLRADPAEDLEVQAAGQQAAQLRRNRSAPRPA